MHLQPHQLLIRHAGGDLLLEHARILEEEEGYDLDADRPPFSETTFTEGTGEALPATLQISARLQGQSLGEADTMLAELENAARSATTILWRDRERGTTGMTDEMMIIPVLRGYRVDFRLAMTSRDWAYPNGQLVFSKPENSMYVSIL
jgi:hypothetical protein